MDSRESGTVRCQKKGAVETREALGTKRIWVLGLRAGEEVQRPSVEGSCHLWPEGGDKRACPHRRALARTRRRLREKPW